MKEIEIFCPVCKEKVDDITEEDLQLGFRLKCESCDFSVHLEDGLKP